MCGNVPHTNYDKVGEARRLETAGKMGPAALRFHKVSYVKELGSKRLICTAVNRFVQLPIDLYSCQSRWWLFATVAVRAKYYAHPRLLTARSG